MNTKCSVYIAASVDGFIARDDGDIEWLHNPAYSSPDRLGLGYKEFIATVDALVMGRGSFEKVLSFSGWPYDGTPVIVLSSKELPIPAHLEGKVDWMRGEPESVVEQFAERGLSHLYIDGGVTIQRFLRARLINELTITRIPILFGSGIPLFGELPADVHLTHIETTTTGGGFVQSRYRVV